MRSGAQTGAYAMPSTDSANGDKITVQMSLTFKRRGGRKQAVTPEGAEEAQGYNAMVKALSQAFRQRKLLYVSV